MRSKSSRRLVALGVTALAGFSFTVLLADDERHAEPKEDHFDNSRGRTRTYSTTGSIDLTGPFFQSLGTNGRSCGTCHRPSDAMSVSAAHIQSRFDATGGLDPIFRPNDGSNCDHNIDLSTVAGRRAAYSLLRTRGLFRISIDVPAGADYRVVSVSNPYGCNETATVSQYRRPLPATNLRFLSAVMWDGRESVGADGKIVFGNYPTSLLTDLAHQAVDATAGHAQGVGMGPTQDQQKKIVKFEMALTTAQATTAGGVNLEAQGVKGGPVPLVTQPFFISINSSVHFLVPTLEMPGDKTFTPEIFNIFDGWMGLPYRDPRASIARGQALFNSKPINITGVAGINDDLAAGGLVSGGIPSLVGTCGTCHDTPNVGSHSFPTPLNIGTGDLDSVRRSVSLGGLNLSYLPKITVCKLGSPSVCKTTTDLGQALIDGKFDHVGKIKGPILRGLSARAPYFHNGSAQTLLDAVRFYEVRFGIHFTDQDEADLVAFLGAL
jgi:cytochrome c peroxidase